MTGFSGGSKKYLTFKILMIVKDVFDLFSYNVTKNQKSLISFGHRFCYCSGLLIKGNGKY